MGTQQRVTGDFLLSFVQASKHVALLSLKGGIGSTNGMYTPKTSHFFLEGNAGFIYRYLQSQKVRVGAYAFLGQLRTPYKHDFSRATIGFECHTGTFREYVNCYLPVGKREKKIGSSFGFDKRGVKISGHKVSLVDCKKIEVLSPYAFDVGVQKDLNRHH